MDYSGHDYQEQEQQQQACDVSQIQAYDQSSQEQFDCNQQCDQQFPYYSLQDNTNCYAQNAHPQFQQEPSSIHPPGVPIPSEPAHIAGLDQIRVQNQQNIHISSGVVENQQPLNPGPGVEVAGSINPAAAAAIAVLSQLTQFAGNMNVAQWANCSPMGQTWYRGGGGRGGRSFRGGGWGQFNHRGPVPYHGRGRGQGGGRHFPSHTSGPSISSVPYALAATGDTSVAQPSSSVPEQILLNIPAQAPTAPLRQPPQKLWCEICKVECNTPEILEQHTNGKRHKKNFQVHEELQRRKALNGQPSGQIPTSQLKPTVQPEKVLESEKKKCPAENMGSEVKATDHKDEIELQNNIGETSEVPAQVSDGMSRNNFAGGGRGLKRKMRGGRGGKYMRTNDGPRRAVEPPNPEQAIPFICELCNVKCESQVVFDSHLTGKKHLSSLKRVHGHEALYGEVGLQASYPLDINALSNSINSQVQQGVSDSQVLLAQLLMTLLSHAQVPAIAPLSGSEAAQIPPPTPAAVSSYKPQVEIVSQPQVSGNTAHDESENHTGETKNQLISAPLGLDAPTSSSTITQTAGGNSETEGKVLKLPGDNSVMTLAEHPGAANDQGPCTITPDKVVSSEREAPTS